MPYNGNFNRYARGSGGYPRNSNTRSGTGGGGVQNPTTNGIVLTNDRQGKFLELSHWGRYMNIAIGSAQGRITFEARRSAPRSTQNITFADLSDLWDLCEEVMDSLKNTGTFTPAGVRVGNSRNTIIEISNGSNINVAPGIYLVMYKDLDNANRTNNVMFYPFDQVTYYRGYDPSTGQAKEDISKTGQFKKFYRTIKEAAKALTMAYAHSTLVNMQSTKITTFKAIAAIAAKLGVDISLELDNVKSNPVYENRSSNNNSYRNSYGGNSNSGGYGYQSPQPAQVFASLNDPVDISLNMDNLQSVDMSTFK